MTLQEELEKILNDAHEMGVIKGKGLADDYTVLKKGMLKKLNALTSKRFLMGLPKMRVITQQPDEYARQSAIGYNTAISDTISAIKETFGGSE